MKMKMLAVILGFAIATTSCNRNKHDTINKTSKIDSGRNADPDSKIHLKLDSADRDSSKMKDTLSTNQ